MLIVSCRNFLLEIFFSEFFYICSCCFLLGGGGRGGSHLRNWCVKCNIEGYFIFKGILFITFNVLCGLKWWGITPPLDPPSPATITLWICDDQNWCIIFQFYTNFNYLNYQNFNNLMIKGHFLFNFTHWQPLKPLLAF